MVVVVDVLSGYGRAILAGLSDFWEMMCFFVVRVSQTGVFCASSSGFSSSLRRLCLPEAVVASLSDFLMWLRRALEALRVCAGQYDCVLCGELLECGSSHLCGVQLIRRSAFHLGGQRWSCGGHFECGMDCPGEFCISGSGKIGQSTSWRGVRCEVL